MLRLTASDPLYAEWNELLTLYAMAVNPACFYDVREVDRDSAEYKADVAEMWNEIEKRYNELVR